MHSIVIIKLDGIGDMIFRAWGSTQFKNRLKAVSLVLFSQVIEKISMLVISFHELFIQFFRSILSSLISMYVSTPGLLCLSALSDGWLRVPR